MRQIESSPPRGVRALRRDAPKRRPATWRRWLRVALLVCGLAGTAWGCASDEPAPSGGDSNNTNAGTNNSGTSNSGTSNSGTNNADAGDGDAGTNNGTSDDTGVDPDVPDQPKVGFGEPCQSNANCESGFCVSSPQGFICSQACGGAQPCPEFGGEPMTCQQTENFGADGVLVCAPTQSSLCQPCFQDSNCFGGACVNNPVGGSFCGIDCGEGGTCPFGTECFEIGPDGESLARPQCLPSNLSCGCDADNAGETRACVRSDDDGRRCFGEETCDPELGWVGCDAQIPLDEVCDGQDNDCNGAIDDGLEATQACTTSNDLGACEGLAVCQGEAGFVCLAPEPDAEACDGLDNDCDGQIDEDFTNADGVLSDPQHCGQCGNDCAARFDLAAETACEVDAETGQAQCVITACIGGYTLAGPTTCLPLASRLCQPCQQDIDCNEEVGDRCVTYEGGSAFCGRSCAPDSPFGVECPDGYTCNPDGQCQLTAGTCLCGPGDNFIRSCAIADPNDPQNNCVGTLTCTDGALSACVPPADACNGFDDDCDGVIDNAFTDPNSGAYITDAHCGQCNTDCGLILSGSGLNGSGVCNGLEAVARGEQPSCVLDCDDGFRDVNGVTADGCECQLVDPDNDDPDLLGVDANCDGIDGVIARGVFVSPTGDDANPGTLEQPLRHIQTAIDRATAERDHVYVASGVYDTSLTLRAGVSVFGGYSFDFRRRDLRGNETAIFGLPPTDAAPGAVNAFGITAAEGGSALQGFTIVGFDTTDAQANSYAVYGANCDEGLALTGNVIRAGNGGNGVKGGSGSEGDSAPDTATTGQTARLSAANSCNNNNNANRSPGGQGAANTCPLADGGTRDVSGGTGGTADCPSFNSPEPSGSNGGGGSDGGGGGYNQQLVPFGGGCACLIPSADGSTEVGLPGEGGDDGSGGRRGNGCSASNGDVVGGHWVAGAPRNNPDRPWTPDRGRGGDGSLGDPGQGGGGGGAGSGVEHGSSNGCNDALDEVIGGGGGGGGAGGCGGTGGTGGTPGGGSFGVFLRWDAAPGSLPVVSDNTIERGFGGTGGDGGEGADGGSGSPGKAALVPPDDQLAGLLACSDPGGRGGDGGAGGAGGGGGGGCGGISAGVYLHNAGGLGTGPLRTSNTFSATGAGGGGGRGGVSNGNFGQDGDDGLYVEVTP